MNLEDKIYYWEPHHLIDDAHSRVEMTVGTAIKYMRKKDPRYDHYKLPDGEVLLDFIILNGAWVNPDTDTYNWINSLGE